MIRHLLLEPALLAGAIGLIAALAHRRGHRKGYTRGWVDSAQLLAVLVLPKSSEAKHDAEVQREVARWQ